MQPQPKRPPPKQIQRQRPMAVVERAANDWCPDCDTFDGDVRVDADADDDDEACRYLVQLHAAAVRWHHRRRRHQRL